MLFTHFGVTSGITRNPKIHSLKSEHIHSFCLESSNQHLDWAKHIDCIGKKVSKDIYLMKRIRPYITQQTALTFYKLQNRALRIVFEVDWSFSSSDLFRVLKVDNLSDRRDKHVFPYDV